MIKCETCDVWHPANYCPRTIITCEDCNLKLMIKDYEHHIKTTCLEWLLRCIWCQKQVRRGLYSTHREESCPVQSYSCPYNCGTELMTTSVFSTQMANHIGMTCPKTWIRCRNHKQQCLYQAARKDFNQEHKCPAEERFVLHEFHVGMWVDFVTPKDNISPYYHVEPCPPCPDPSDVHHHIRLLTANQYHTASSQRDREPVKQMHLHSLIR